MVETTVHNVALIVKRLVRRIREFHYDIVLHDMYEACRHVHVSRTCQLITAIVVLINTIALVHVYTTPSHDVHLGFSPPVVQSAIPMLTYPPVRPEPRHIAVMYLMDDHDPLYRHNMLYFIEQTVMMESTASREPNSVAAPDAIDYYFIIQCNNKTTYNDIASWLPPLPSNAQMTWHPNHCFDWGTFGWFLNLAPADTIHQSFDDAPEWDSQQQPRLKHTIEYYDYFMFVNSGVRGPFFPTYYRPTNWYDPFIQPIIATTNDQYPTKLVGCTINCDLNIHVQSYAVAIDQTGIQNLRTNQSSAFECHTDMEITIHQAELGISQAMVTNGYNIEALAMFWRGINFARQHAEQSSVRIDGGTLSCANNHDVRIFGFPEQTGWSDYEFDPMEVVFAKVQEKWTDQTQARRTRMKAEAQSHMHKVGQERIKSQTNTHMFGE